MPKFKRIILPDGKTKLERIPDSPEVIESNRKLREEKIKLNKEIVIKRKELIENIIKIIPKEIYNKDKELSKRFFSKIDIKNEDECWNWLVNKNCDGYGIFKYNNDSIYAHRMSWLIFNNEIPKELYVLHLCDNRKCVNPKHLKLGTQQDNMKDMVNKGRNCNLKGEEHGGSKLTWNQINEMRKLYLTRKYTQKQLSLMYDSSPSNIDSILNNKTWEDKNYVPIHIDGKEGERSRFSKLTWVEVYAIREKYCKYGIRVGQLCREFGVTDGAIYKILHNLSWFDIGFNPLLIIEKRDNEIREKFFKEKVSIDKLCTEYGLTKKFVKYIIDIKEV